METADVLRQQIAHLKLRRAALMDRYGSLKTGEARDFETELRVLERAISTHEEHLRHLDGKHR